MNGSFKIRCVDKKSLGKSAINWIIDVKQSNSICYVKWLVDSQNIK